MLDGMVKKWLMPLVSLILVSCCVNAAQFQIIDQHGKPVSNAVLVAASETVPSVDGRMLASVTMDQVDKQFLPHVLVVRKGQAVNFPNSDDIRHHVYSFSKPNAFEIKLYSGSMNEPVRFDSSGIVVLGCNIHDGMKGYLFVSDVGNAAVSDKSGYVTLDTDQSSSYSAWHSRLQQGIGAPVMVTPKEVIDENSTDIAGLRQVQLILRPPNSNQKKQFRARFK